MSQNANLFRANGRGGFGSETAVDPPDDPRKPLNSRLWVLLTASHKILTLQAVSSSLNAGTAKRGEWAEERLSGDLRQSVPQNGRVHLHILELNLSGAFLKIRVWMYCRGRLSVLEPRKVQIILLKLRRLTIRGAQPSARLSEGICISEGFLEASAGVARRVLRALRCSAGVHGIFRGFSGVVTLP